MSSLSRLSTLLCASVLLAGVAAPDTLGAQTLLSRAEHAPSAALTLAEHAALDTAPPTPAVSSHVAAGAAGPWASTVAFSPTASVSPGAATYQDDPHLGGGKNLAMMGVGAAAVAIGMLVGDTAGTGIAVGGGLLGLYGLYRFLK